MDQSAMHSTIEDEPTPKQMKTSQDGTFTSQWDHLPSLVLTEVFSMLNKKDRRNASGVCKIWRETYFQPRWWSSMKFSIQPNESEKAGFLTDTFGLTVTYAKIVLHSVSGKQLKELIKLLRNLARNNNLKDLVIEYSPANVELLSHFIQAEDRLDDLEEVANLLNMCLPRLSGFTAACMGALSLCVETIMKNLNPSLLTRLGLTSMASYSEKNYLDQALFRRLTKLEELSLDQHTISDELLDVVESCRWLKKLVIYHRSYQRKVDPSGRAVKFHREVQKTPSRRFIQFFRSHRVCYRIIQKGNAGREIIVKRILLF